MANVLAWGSLGAASDPSPWHWHLPKPVVSLNQVPANETQERVTYTDQKEDSGHGPIQETRTSTHFESIGGKKHKRVDK